MANTKLDMWTMKVRKANADKNKVLEITVDKNVVEDWNLKAGDRITVQLLRVKPKEEELSPEELKKAREVEALEAQIAELERKKKEIKGEPESKLRDAAITQPGYSKVWELLIESVHESGCTAQCLSVTG